MSSYLISRHNAFSRFILLMSLDLIFMQVNKTAPKLHRYRNSYSAISLCGRCFRTKQSLEKRCGCDLRGVCDESAMLMCLNKRTAKGQSDFSRIYDHDSWETWVSPPTRAHPFDVRRHPHLAFGGDMRGRNVGYRMPAAKKVPMQLHVQAMSLFCYNVKENSCRCLYYLRIYLFSTTTIEPSKRESSFRSVLRSSSKLKNGFAPA